jgi:hypothetical protein
MASNEEILIAMQEGFTAIHKKIDAANEAFYARFAECQTQRHQCFQRLSELEKKNAVKEAVNGVKHAQTAEHHDFWKYVIRGLTLAIFLALLTVIWKLFIGHIEIITQPIPSVMPPKPTAYELTISDPDIVLQAVYLYTETEETPGLRDAWCPWLLAITKINTMRSLQDAQHKREKGNA